MAISDSAADSMIRAVPVGSSPTPDAGGGRRGIRMVKEANPSSQGTIFSNPSAGVDSSSAAPTMPPTAATGASARSRGAWPTSSGREPSTDPTPVNTSATVLVTFALTGASPTASSAGSVANDANPAMLQVSPPTMLAA